jgi:branched-chain amino acid transport system permease protein
MQLPSGIFNVSYRQDESVFHSTWQRVWLGFLLVLLLVFPYTAPPFFVSLAVHVGIFIVGSHGINLLTGYTGQISLGHGAFMGVGAYASTILMTRLGLPFWLTIPGAGVITALVGMVFGIPSLRLKGLYLAIATLAAQFIIEFVIRRWDSLTGGVQGLSVPPISILGHGLTSDRQYYYLVLLFVILVTWATKNLVRSRVGRAFVAIRDSDLAAEVIGVNLFKYKLAAFGISSFYAGVAGALWAHSLGVINYDQFGIGLSVEYLAFIIIGGMGNVLGAIFGPIFLITVTELLSHMTSALSTQHPSLLTILVSMREILFGIIIIGFLIFEPDGLAARWRSIRAYWKLYPFSY